jgi:nitrate/nitrite transporter NarK
MFPTVALLTVLPVLYLGHFADSLTDYLVGGFFLGLGGTTFAIGVPFVNSWYPHERRGLALGIFGAGMGGTAISAFSIVQLAAAFGPSFPFDLVAVVLGVGTGAVFALVARLVEPERVGAVTGVVGAAGGLGGFFPPLVMGWSTGRRATTRSDTCYSRSPRQPPGALTTTAVRRRVEERATA